jgi:Ser/Thr protein kinase RdoA (MazF antagonist)
MLEQSDIAHYLLSLGLVKPRDVVDEDLTVVDVSRRNCVFLATTRAGPSFVVKQAGPRSAGTLAHEAAVLGALAGAAELAGRVPVVVHNEPAAGRLVVRTPGGARDWGDHHGRFPRIPARLLGRTLAALHRLPAGEVEALPPDVDRMWALSLPEPPHELVLDLSSGAQEVVARVQAGRHLCERLGELRDAPGEDALVHGDLRWANCLALAAPGAERRTRVVLVDWELAGPGAAAFDVGTVLAEYLSVWIGSIPIADPADPGRLIARARHPLERMRPAIHDFWSAYRLANPLHPTLRRVVELGAVRLLQTAVEHAQGLAAPTAHVMTLVQLADNLLRDPDDAALTLLALRE